MYLSGVLFEAVDQLIKERFRKVEAVAFNEAMSYMSQPYLASEFCTLSLDPGRRTGKTSYILARADKSRDAVVVGFTQQANDYRRKGFRNVYTGDDLCRLMAHPQSLMEIRHNMVWVDEPAQLARKLRRHELYALFCSPGHIPWFVMLGRQ